MSKRIFQIFVLTSLMLGRLWAGTDPFVGKWKLNLSQSHYTDRMRVEAAGENKYTFNFGGPQSETIEANGTDQPGLDGTTLAVTMQDAHTWKVVRKKEGRTLLTASWSLSEDGRVLRDAFTTFAANGTPSTVNYVYERTAGTSGFPGTWESTSVQLDTAFELQIQPYEGGGLSFIRPAAGTTKNVSFDGRDLPSPSIAQGFTSSGRRVDENTLELTDKLNGNVLDTQELGVSADGKVLTMKVHPPGSTRPNVLVFERE